MNRAGMMAGVLAMLIATAAWAEGPATRPMPLRGKREGPIGKFERPPGPRPMIPTAEQWDETVKFMEANSPNRLKMITRNPPERLKAMIWSRYAHLKQIEKEGDTALRDIVLEQIKTEDAVWGAAMEWGMAPADQRGQMRGRIAEAIKRMLDVHFKERQLRIERLEQSLKKAKDELAADEASVDKLSKDRVDEIIAELQALREKRTGEGPPERGPRPHREGPRGDGPPRERDGRGEGRGDGPGERLPPPPPKPD